MQDSHLELTAAPGVGDFDFLGGVGRSRGGRSPGGLVGLAAWKVPELAAACPRLGSVRSVVLSFGFDENIRPEGKRNHI